MKVMLSRLKKALYFPCAAYFRFFARIQLKKWQPRVIVVTGSSGKTTLLHLIEAQLGTRGRYSHHANSSFGIPFDILGLSRKTFAQMEWLKLILLAPTRAYKKPFAQGIYIVEADCDRPGEGKFLASLLKPEVTLWLSLSRTHTVNFDKLIASGQFSSIEKAIAYEFGHFLATTHKLAIVNGDSPYIKDQFSRTKVKVKTINMQNNLAEYKVLNDRTEFTINAKTYAFSGLLPKEAFYSVAMSLHLAEYLGIATEDPFAHFQMPPSRGSIFAGIKNTVLIDSTYNNVPDATAAMLSAFDLYPKKPKWAVLRDMRELGLETEFEHTKLAKHIAKLNLDRVILVGQQLARHCYPILISTKVVAEKLQTQRDALNYLQSNIEGEEAILFKGILEGTVERLLENSADAAKLCRREKIWQIRRKRLGL